MEASILIELFAPGVEERLGWYVYLLIDPRNNAIFYVGKGKGQRCFAHLHEARATTADVLDGYAKLSRIRAIEACGQTVGISLLRHGLEENEAHLVEAVCIDLLDGLVNIARGHGSGASGLMSVAHANDLHGARPIELDPDHNVVLVRISRTYHREMTGAEIYEATRNWWKIASWRCDLKNPGTPKWAMGVANGIVRGVYRIEAWERPAEADIAVDIRRRGRWGFRGHRDPDMERLYLGGDVSRYWRSSQWPLHFEPR